MLWLLRDAQLVGSGVLARVCLTRRRRRTSLPCPTLSVGARSGKRDAGGGKGERVLFTDIVFDLTQRAVGRGDAALVEA